MKYDIAWHKGAGPFKFGMSPSEVRKAAAAHFESFNRTPASQHPTDHFNVLGVFANYAADGHLEALEFVAPALPLLGDASLLDIQFAEAKKASDAERSKH